MFKDIGIISVLVLIGVVFAVVLMGYIVYLRKLLNGHKTGGNVIAALHGDVNVADEELKTKDVEIARLTKELQTITADRNKLDQGLLVAKDINRQWQSNYDELMKQCNALNANNTELQSQIHSYRNASIEFKVTPEEQALLEKIINLVIKYNVGNVEELQKVVDNKEQSQETPQ